MMSTLKYLCLSFLLSAFSLTGTSQIADCMTFNIRYDNPNDGPDWWNYRKAGVAKLINKYHPDFIGIQEGLRHQVHYLDYKLPAYDYIGVGRDDGKAKGEYTAILYDTTQFQVIKQSTFWLSESPDEISVGWDASMERICTYGLFQSKLNDEQFWIFNTHFDHRGKLAREKSAELILEKIDELTDMGDLVVVMGDLNSEPETTAINTLAAEMKTASADKITGAIGTWASFDITHIPERLIDYIFIKNGSIINYKHIDDRLENGRWPSDHLPVMMSF